MTESAQLGGYGNATLRHRIDVAVKALISAIEFAVVVESSETVTPLQGELLKGLLAAKEALRMAEGAA